MVPVQIPVLADSGVVNITVEAIRRVRNAPSVGCRGRLNATFGSTRGYDCVLTGACFSFGHAGRTVYAYT